MSAKVPKPPPENKPKKVLAEISSSKDPLEVKIIEGPPEMPPPKDPLEVKITKPVPDRWFTSSNIILSLVVIASFVGVSISYKTANIMKEEAETNRIHTIKTIDLMKEEADENRKYNRLLVQPHLRTTRDTASGQEQWGIYLENVGLGPAIIKNITLSLDGKNYPIHTPENSKKALTLIGEKIDIDNCTVTGPSIRLETRVAKGEKLPIILIDLNRLSDVEKQEVKLVLQKIHIPLEYESLLGDKHKK